MSYQSPDELDPDFYRSTYPDVEGLPRWRLRRHWSRQGIQEGRYPNRFALERKASELGIDVERFSPAEYLALNRDLPSRLMEGSRALHHYLSTGMGEGRPLNYSGVDLAEKLSYLESYIESLFESVDARTSTERIALLHFVIKRTSLSDHRTRMVAEEVDHGKTTLTELFARWFREVTVAEQHDIERDRSDIHKERERSHSSPGKTDSVPILGRTEIIDPRVWEERLEVIQRTRRGSAGADSTKRSSSFTPQDHDQPKISVLASLYKADEHLDVYLENLREQDALGISEVIFVLVQPSSNVVDKIRSFWEAVPHTQVHVTRNVITIYEAWNLAIRSSTAPFITNANADDSRRHDSLRLQMELLESNPDIDVVFQDYYFALKPHLPWDVLVELGYHTSLQDVRFPEILESLNSPHCAPMWRRSLHGELGLFNGDYRSAGDSDFWLRCLLAGKRFMKSPDVHAAYYFNPEGLSTRTGSSGFTEGERIRRKYWWLYRQGLANAAP